MRRFEPVFLLGDRKVGDRASQTMLRHYQACPRSGFLYALTRGQVRTVEMMRGAAGHAIFERSTRLALEQGEAAIPPEVVKVIVDEVLADPEFPVPFEEHDYLREASFRWAAETAFPPADRVVAVESLFALDVDGFQVRCKVDYAELAENGSACHVVDYKTGRGAPSFEDVARKLPDGRLAAKSFQLVLYALALAFGVPVRVEECGECGGAGYVPEDRTDDRVIHLPCSRCGGHYTKFDAIPGSGRVEIPEPFPVASRAQRFDLEYVFPGIEDREGRMLRRPVTLTRPELFQYRASLEGLVARVRHSEAEGDWPAVVSDAACAECPASALCPIPAELRDHRGEINTVEQAAEALEVRHREGAVGRAKQKELRAFIERNGSVRFGNGMVAELAYSEHEEVTDKEGLLAAVERAVRYGDPFERWRYVKTKGRTRMKERALTAEELAEEVDDGREEDGRDGDPERARDERFGADAPW